MLEKHMGNFVYKLFLEFADQKGKDMVAARVPFLCVSTTELETMMSGRMPSLRQLCLLVL
jgi:hypothetical protein